MTVMVVSSTLVFVGATTPELLPATALMSAALLSLHAFRRPAAPPACVPFERTEYRGVIGAAPERAPILEPSPADERTRKLAWAGYALYLSAWSAGFAGVDFPAHLLLLELGLAAPMLIVAARRRSIAIAAPLFATWTHWAIHTRSLRAPQSMLQWGITTISAGFALLFLSLFASWRLRDTTPAHPTEGAPR